MRQHSEAITARDSSGKSTPNTPTTSSEHTTPGRTPTKATQRGITSPRDEARDLLFDCDRSARYHTARSAFFDFWHRWMMVAVLLSGSAIVATLDGGFGASTLWRNIFALIPAIVGAVSVVWDLAHKARDHTLLAHRFHGLSQRIKVRDDDEQSVEEWRGMIIGIYGDEPAVYHALNAECHNSVAQAIGSSEEPDATGEMVAPCAA